MNGTHSDGCIEVPSGVTTVATPQKPRSALDRQPPKPIPELPNLLEWSHRMAQTSVKKSHPVEGGLRGFTHIRVTAPIQIHQLRSIFS